MEQTPALRPLVEAAGLFDRDYYVSCYRELIEDGVDPLDHYLDADRHRDLKPNAWFDPLVYLLRHPDSKPNPLLHFLEHRPGHRPDLSVAAGFPGIAPPDWSILKVEPGLVERDLKDNLAHSARYGDAQTLDFTLDGQDYSLVAPSAEAFFAQLRDDRPFAYPRLPHGFWDCLLELQAIRAKLAEAAPAGLFSATQLDRLACRLCDELMPALGVFAEHFLPEMLDGLAREKSLPGYQRSVSFKWRPTIDDRVFARTATLGPIERQLLQMFVERFNRDAVVHEAMIWKRWVYSGDVQRLPPLARARPVILVGAARVGDLGARWQLPWFELVEIQASSYTIRYDVLDRIKDAVRRAEALTAQHSTGRPLVLLQGGSFAYWLIARLHGWDPSIFYFDLGQALHIWFLDNEDLWWHWLTLHPRLVMENCRLDDFYRDLGITLPPPFGGDLAAGAETTLPGSGQSKAERLAAQESTALHAAKLQSICDERQVVIEQLQSACDERLAVIERLHTKCEERLRVIEQLQAACDQRGRLIQRLQRSGLDQAEELERLRAAVLRHGLAGPVAR